MSQIDTLSTRSNQTRSFVTKKITRFFVTTKTTYKMYSSISEGYASLSVKDGEKNMNATLRTFKQQEPLTFQQDYRKLPKYHRRRNPRRPIYFCGERTYGFAFRRYPSNFKLLLQYAVSLTSTLFTFLKNKPIKIPFRGHPRTYTVF